MRLLRQVVASALAIGVAGVVAVPAGAASAGTCAIPSSTVLGISPTSVIAGGTLLMHVTVSEPSGLSAPSGVINITESTSGTVLIGPMSIGGGGTVTSPPSSSISFNYVITAAGTHVFFAMFSDPANQVCPSTSQPVTVVVYPNTTITPTPLPTPTSVGIVTPVPTPTPTPTPKVTPTPTPTPTPATTAVPTADAGPTVDAGLLLLNNGPSAPPGAAPLGSVLALANQNPNQGQLTTADIPLLGASAPTRILASVFDSQRVPPIDNLGKGLALNFGGGIDWWRWPTGAAILAGLAILYVRRRWIIDERAITREIGDLGGTRFSPAHA